MKLLAIETACAACSAAIWADGSIRASRFAPMARGQAEALMPMIQDVVARGGVPFEALDLVAVTVGPGSFTGLRTGLAAARGIALARGLPVLGVTTLETVAAAARHAAPDMAARRPIVVVLESRRTDVYAQYFDRDLAPVCEPFTAPPGEVAANLPAGPVLLAGDATDRILETRAIAAAGDVARAEAELAPDAVFVAEIAALRWAAAGAVAADAVPLYLHPPEAKRPVAGGRLRP